MQPTTAHHAPAVQEEDEHQRDEGLWTCAEVQYQGKTRDEQQEHACQACQQPPAPAFGEVCWNQLRADESTDRLCIKLHAQQVHTKTKAATVGVKLGEAEGVKRRMGLNLESGRASRRVCRVWSLTQSVATPGCALQPSTHQHLRVQLPQRILHRQWQRGARRHSKHTTHIQQADNKAFRYQCHKHDERRMYMQQRASGAHVNSSHAVRTYSGVIGLQHSYRTAYACRAPAMGLICCVIRGCMNATHR